MNIQHVESEEAQRVLPQKLRCGVPCAYAGLWTMVSWYHPDTIFRNVEVRQPMRDWLRTWKETHPDWRSAVLLPVYLLDTDRVALSTHSGSREIGAGQIGWIYALPADIRERYGCQQVTQNIRRHVWKALEGEVKTHGLCLQAVGDASPIIHNQSQEAWRAQLILDEETPLHPRRGGSVLDSPGAQSAYARKARERHSYPGMFAHVRRLDADGDERSGPDWTFETPIFFSFGSLQGFVRERGQPGRYHLWLYHAWDRQQLQPVGVTSLIVTAAKDTSDNT